MAARTQRSCIFPRSRAADCIVWMLLRPEYSVHEPQGRTLHGIRTRYGTQKMSIRSKRSTRNEARDTQYPIMHADFERVRNALRGTAAA